MFDLSNEVVDFHNEKASLPQSERTNMRTRRNANRDRLKKALSERKRPTPIEFVSQGSYAMKTMTQHPKNDYDIDDGVYFEKAELIGERSAPMNSLQARHMVRDALDDGSFKTPPEVRKNCVRVHYLAGYQVDVPVYRKVQGQYTWDKPYFELASSDWVRSDAREVTKWFDTENINQSPDTENGRQLRRIVRLIKKLSRSRESWSDFILGGFGITKLVTECYKPDAREDRAFYKTIEAIQDRLNFNLVVAHPVTPAATITKGYDDARARFLRERLTDTLESLAILFASDCTREKALKAWDKAFATSYFVDYDKPKAKSAEGLLKSASTAAPAGAHSFPNVPRSDDKPRGFG